MEISSAPLSCKPTFTSMAGEVAAREVEQVEVAVDLFSAA